MLVTLGTYRAYNTKIQLLLAAVCLSGSSRPLKGGGSSFKQKFSVLRATVWSKNRGGGGRAPLDRPLLELLQFC